MHDTNVTEKRSQLIMSSNYKRNNFQCGGRGGRDGHQKHDQLNKLTFQPKKPFERNFKEENRKELSIYKKEAKENKNSRLSWEAKIQKNLIFQLTEMMTGMKPY